MRTSLTLAKVPQIQKWDCVHLCTNGNPTTQNDEKLRHSAHSFELDAAGFGNALPDEEDAYEGKEGVDAVGSA